MLKTQLLIQFLCWQFKYLNTIADFSNPLNCVIWEFKFVYMLYYSPTKLWDSIIFLQGMQRNFHKKVWRLKKQALNGDVKSETLSFLPQECIIIYL